MSGEVNDPTQEHSVHEAIRAGEAERYERHKDRSESFLPDPEGVIVQGEILELPDGDYVFMGIDASGAAIVRKQNGTEQTFDEGEVDIEALRSAKRSQAQDADEATPEEGGSPVASLESFPELESELAQRIELNESTRALLEQPRLSESRRKSAEAFVASNERRFREIADTLGIADADPRTISVYVHELRERQRAESERITPEEEADRDPKEPPTRLEVERASIEERIRAHQGDTIPKWLLRKHKDSPYVREHVLESARAAMLSADTASLSSLEDWELLIANEHPAVRDHLKRHAKQEDEERPVQPPAWQKLKEQSELAAMPKNEGHDEPVGSRVIDTLRNDLRSAGLDERRIEALFAKQLKKNRRRTLHASDVVDIRRIALGQLGTKQIAEMRPEGDALELTLEEGGNEATYGDHLIDIDDETAPTPVTTQDVFEGKSPVESAMLMVELLGEEGCEELLSVADRIDQRFTSSEKNLLAHAMLRYPKALSRLLETLNGESIFDGEVASGLVAARRTRTVVCHLSKFDLSGVLPEIRRKIDEARKSLDERTDMPLIDEVEQADSASPYVASVDRGEGTLHSSDLERSEVGQEERKDESEPSDEVEISTLGDWPEFAFATGSDDSFAESDLVAPIDTDRQESDFPAQAEEYWENFDPFSKYWDDFKSPVIERLEREGKLDFTYEGQEDKDALTPFAEAMLYLIENSEEVGGTAKTKLPDTSEADVDADTSVVTAPEEPVVEDLPTGFELTRALKEIMKAKREDRPALLEAFKERLARQRKGLAETQAKLVALVRENPEMTEEEFMMRFDELAAGLDFNKEQRLLAKNIYENYRRKHEAIETYITMYPDAKDLFTAAFGIAPKGEVEIVKGPMTLCFKLKNDDDFAVVYNNEHLHATPELTDTMRRRAAGSSGIKLNVCPRIPELAGVLLAERSSVVRSEAHSREILAHEEEHALHTIFPVTSLRDPELAGQRTHRGGEEWKNAVLLPLEPRLEAIRPRIIEAARREFVNAARMELAADREYVADRRAKDEILAFTKDGTSLDDIYANLMVPKSAGGTYEYLINFDKTELPRGIAAATWISDEEKTRLKEELTSIAKEIKQRYPEDLRSALDAWQSLRDAGFAEDAIRSVFIHEPLVRWEKVATRLVEEEKQVPEAIIRGFESAFKGVDEAMLERIPGFRTLSEGQQRLALEKMRAASLEDIEKEQVMRYRKQIDDLAANPSDSRVARFGKLLKRGWKGFTKKWEFGRIKDEVKNEWQNAEDFDSMKMKEETLAAIVDGIRTTQAFGLDKEGKSIVFVDESDVPGADRRTKERIAEFNALANDYANARYGEDRAVENAELTERFGKSAKEMTALLAKSGGRKNGGEEGAAAWRVRLESALATERFSKGREEVLEEYDRSGRNIGAAIGFRDLLLSRGSFAAVTASARYLGMATIGLSALPVIAAASAGTMSTFRSMERNRENDLLARLGERDRTDDGSKGKERSRLDNSKEKAKNVVSGTALAAKLESVLREYKAASSTEPYEKPVAQRDHEGNLIMNARTNTPKRETITEKAEAKRRLEARLAYTTRKLEEELVDLGKEPAERADARARIALALGKARAELDFAEPSTRNATVVRLRSILDIREKKIERNRLKSIVYDGAKAAVIGYALSWGARYVAGMLPGAKTEGSMKLPWGEKKVPPLANVPVRPDAAPLPPASLAASAPEAPASAASAASVVEKAVEKAKEIKDTLIGETDASKLAKQFVEQDLVHSPSKEIAQSWALLHDRDVSSLFAETKESAMARPGGADEWSSIVRIREYLKENGLLKDMIAPKRGETLEQYVRRAHEDRLIHLGKTTAASVEQPVIAPSAKDAPIVPKAVSPESVSLPERRLSELSAAEKANWPTDKPLPWPTSAAEAEGLFGDPGSKTRILAEEIKQSVGRYPNEEEFLAYRKVEGNPSAAKGMIAAMKKAPLSFADTRKLLLGGEVSSEAPRTIKEATAPESKGETIYKPEPFKPRRIDPAGGEPSTVPRRPTVESAADAPPRVIYQPKPFVPRTLDGMRTGSFAPTNADTADIPRMTRTSFATQETSPFAVDAIAAKEVVRAPYEGMEADVDRALSAQKEAFRSMYGSDAEKTPAEIVAKYGNDNRFAKQVAEYAKRGIVPKEGESAVDFILRAYKESLLVTKTPQSGAIPDASSNRPEAVMAAKESVAPPIIRVVTEGRYRDPAFVKEIADAWKSAAEHGVSENPHWGEVARLSPREVVVATYSDKNPGSIGAAHAEMVIELKKAYQTGFVPNEKESCSDFLKRVGDEIGSAKPSQERIKNLWNAIIGNERLDGFPSDRAHASELLAGNNPTGVDPRLFTSMRTRIEKLTRLSGLLPDDPRENVDEYARRAIRAILAKNPLLSLRTLDLMPVASGLGKEV